MAHQHHDEPLDVETMSAAINAALVVCSSGGYDAATRAKYIDLLDRIIARHAQSSDAKIIRLRHTAAIVSVLLRGRHGSELWKLRKISVSEARSRLTKAIFVHHTIVPLPRVAREIAGRLLEQFPKPTAKPELQVRVIAHMKEKKKRLFSDDFAAYRRLLEPIGLVSSPNAAALGQALECEFPWMTSITKHIVRELALGEYAGRRYLRLPRLLLVGDAGVGKTYFLKRLAELTGAPFRMVSAAGESDSMSLRGTSAGWSSARPSVVIQLLLQHLVANPLVGVDEIDKASTSRHNGAIHDSLLPLLDPVERWFCPALETAVDLSYCNFIMTANSLAPLPRPLLDRVQILHAPKPSREHFPLIVDSVLRNLAAELHLADHRLLPEIAPDEREHLVRNCENVRQLARAVRRIVSDKAAAFSHPEALH